MKGSSERCARGDCLKPAVVDVKADGKRAGLCQVHHDEIVARVEARAPWWKKGDLCFRQAVLREVQNWKQKEATCHFCGEMVVGWRYEGWCCCAEHWPRVLK